MADIRLARCQSSDFFGIDIEANDGKVFFAKTEHQRQSDISQSDDANSSCSSLEAGEELILIELGVVRLSSARNYGKGRPQ